MKSYKNSLTFKISEKYLKKFISFSSSLLFLSNIKQYFLQILPKLGNINVFMVTSRNGNKMLSQLFTANLMKE